MSRPQYMEALDQANEVRHDRAVLKRKIKAGGIYAGDVVLDPPDYAQTMTVAELLGSQQRWGAVRVAKFLRSYAVGESRPLSALTERQRHLLSGALR